MGINLNQNIKIMDKKELKDKIISMRSYDLIELACTIREIMREHGILKINLKQPALCYRELYKATSIAVSDTPTAIPVITLTMVSYNRTKQKVLATDYPWMDFESLSRIASELNNELEG